MLIEKVESAIQDVRPSLQADGGDIEFVSVDESGKVLVKLKGACNGCPMAQMTLKDGVEKYLKSKELNPEPFLAVPFRPKGRGTFSALTRKLTR